MRLLLCSVPFSRYDRFEQSPQLLCGLRVYRPQVWNRWSGGGGHAAVRWASGRRKSVPFLRPPNRQNQGSVLVRRWICPLVQASVQRSVPVAQVRSRASTAGSPELPLAHGGPANRAENRYPQRKAQRSFLSKNGILLYFILPLCYNNGRINLFSEENLWPQQKQKTHIPLRK